LQKCFTRDFTVTGKKGEKGTRHFLNDNHHFKSLLAKISTSPVRAKTGAILWEAQGSKKYESHTHGKN
jgi:hypothetical protein